MLSRLTRSLLLLSTVCLAFPLSTPAQNQGPFETTSLLDRKLYAQADDANITAAKAKLSSGSPTAADFLTLSTAQAGRRQYQEAVKTDTEGLAKFPDNPDLLLERGHRELGLREFAAAQKDLQQAVQLNPGKLEAHYHLGLAHFFQGQFAEAAMHFRHARDLAKSDDDLIDCSNWLYVSLRRANKPTEAADALMRITPSVHNKEAHLAFYLRLLHFYQGQMTAPQILPAKPQPGDTEAELAYDTINYGVGNWHVYNGDKTVAIPFFKNVVAGEAWNAWGFIGSETELARH